ncbi:MAG TPA: hypothetical protein VK666_24495, partial [Chryseolinea sp.]|nr:hypothetical protein [Chryseolinea sp.]
MKLTVILLCLLLSEISYGQRWTETKHQDFSVITNPGGQNLGYSPTSGIKILTVDGLAFKDLNRNGTLDKYEDWRLTADVRAKDLATKLTVEQIAGLMLYSGHQSIPAGATGFRAGTYNGKKISEGGALSSDVTDQQKTFLTNDNLRHVLITSVESPEVAAKWNNNVQALVEGLGYGVPVNTSSDPRHGAQGKVEYTEGG